MSDTCENPRGCENELNGEYVTITRTTNPSTNYGYTVEAGEMRLCVYCAIDLNLLDGEKAPISLGVYDEEVDGYE